MSDGEEALHALSTSGFRLISGDQLPSIVAWCADECEATGDARFCIVGDTLEGLMDWCAENKTGVPSRLLSSIEASILALLPGILSAQPADASRMAARLRSEVGERLLSTNQWAPWL